MIDRRSCVLFFVLVSANASAQSRRIAFNDAAPAQARAIKKYSDRLVVQNTGATTTNSMTTTVSASGAALTAQGTTGVVRASTVTGIPATAASPLGAAYSPAAGPVPVANQVPLLPEKSGGGNGGGGSPGGGGGGGSPQQKEEAAAAEKKQKAKMEEARDELDEREKKIKKREEEQDKKDKQKPSSDPEPAERLSSLDILKKFAEAAKENSKEAVCTFKGGLFGLGAGKPAKRWIPLRVVAPGHGNRQGTIHFIDEDGLVEVFKFEARNDRLKLKSQTVDGELVGSKIDFTKKAITNPKFCYEAQELNKKLTADPVKTEEPSRFDKPAAGASRPAGGNR